MTKQQFFVSRPISIPTKYDGIGVSYRQLSGRTFYEFAFNHQKKDVILSSFLEGIEDKEIGALHNNQLLILQGVMTNTPYVQFYTSGGVGVEVPYATIGKTGQSMYPLVAGKVGLAFRYGFFDLGVNVPFPKFKYEASVDGNTSEFVWTVLATTRMGFGFSF